MGLAIGLVGVNTVMGAMILNQINAASDSVAVPKPTNITDLSTVLSEYGKHSAGTISDINRDGQTDIMDVSTVLQRYDSAQ